MRQLTLPEIQQKLLALMTELHVFLEKQGISYYIIGGTLLGAIRHKGFIPWDDDIDIAMTRENYERFLSVRTQFNPKYRIVSGRDYPYADFLLTRVLIPHTKIDSAYRSPKIDAHLYLDVFPLDFVPERDPQWTRFSKKVLSNRKKLYFFYAKKHPSSLKRFGKVIIAAAMRPFKRTLLAKAEKLIVSTDAENRNKYPRYLCSCASQYAPQKQKMREEIYGEPTLYTFEEKEFYGPADYDTYLKQLYGPDYMDVPDKNKRRTPSTVWEIEEE